MGGEGCTKEMRLALDLEDELGWAAEKEQFDQYRDRNNFELGKRDYSSKVTVRGFFFIKVRWVL